MTNKIALVLAGILVVGLLAVINVSSAPKPLTTHQKHLLAQVENKNGTPRNGFDPAGKKQISLAAAASQSVGNGQRVDKPAANIKGTQRQVNPASVLPDPKKTGKLANGCLVGYGKPGEQCIPAARTTGNKSAACKFVRTLFPQGIAVTGTDQHNLDKNNDDIACGISDR